MILSRTSQYAVQALIYMATQPAAAPVLNKDIASQLGVPAPYLAKILQSLAKGNLLFSFRGRLGGFCLRDGGEKITLMQILLLTGSEIIAAVRSASARSSWLRLS